MKKLAIVIIGVWLAVGAALLVWKQYTKGNSTDSAAEQPPFKAQQQAGLTRSRARKAVMMFFASFIMIKSNARTRYC